MKKIIVLGAGVSGLRVGSKLKNKFDVTVVEKNSGVGGLCGSFKYKDSILDYGPHKLYSQITGLMDEFKIILGKECLTVKKKNSLRLMGKYFEFPIKITQMIKNVNVKTVSTGIGMGFSYSAALLRGLFGRKKNITYEDYFINGFGKKGYDVLFRDLAWKVWGDPKFLDEKLARRRVPVPSILGIIQSFLSKKEKQKVSAEYFYYPKKGIGVVCNKLAKGLKIHSKSRPVSINIENNKVVSVTYLKDGRKVDFKADYLVSTIPINEMLNLISPKPKIVDTAKFLKYRGLILIYLTIDKPRFMDDVWVFFLDKEVVFSRVSEQKNFSKHTVPENKTIITVEITADEKDELWEMSDKEIVRKVVKDLKKCKLLKNERITDNFVKRIKDVYPVLSIGYEKRIEMILDYIDTIPNLYTIGRYGMFNYNNMDHCIDMSDKTAEHIIKGKGKREWKQKRKIFDSYRIVD